MTTAAAVRPNFIAGEWTTPNAATPNRNPSDLSDIVGEYAKADEAETEWAIQSAAQAAPSFALSPAQDRADLLDRIGSDLIARAAVIGEVLSREEGKILKDGVAEVARAGRIFKFFAGEVMRGGGERLPSARPGVAVEVSREPVGVVAVITPWNFPIAIPAWKIAPALAYGNTVVFKPADLVPGSAWELTSAIVGAGVPAGVFNLVMGRGSVVGEALVASPDIDAISFTGSIDVGRGIVSRAVARMAKVQAEMGGKNPLVILDDADFDVAVECALQGAFEQTGQRCTASSRLIVGAGIHDRFVAALAERLSGLTVGHALRPETRMGPVVDEAQLAQDLRYIEIGSREGATLMHGGDVLERDTEGFFLSPALFVEATNEMTISREEIFGPVASVIRVRDYPEALAVANDTPFGLSAGIITSSLRHAEHFKRNSEAGMVMVNLPTAGVDYHVPFGGRKQSSYGPREQGSYAAEFYTSVKTAYVRS
ncbi:MAG: aldehyde dehydrogenase family protein [Candidatus Dormibacteraceae bacterium]